MEVVGLRFNRPYCKNSYDFQNDIQPMPLISAVKDASGDWVVGLFFLA